MRHIISFILCIIAGISAWADNTITATNATAKAGETITLNINMSNDMEVCAYQFDMLLPEGITVATDAAGRCQAKLGERTNGSRHNLMCVKQPDGTVRFLCFSLYNYAFSSTNGCVATVQLNVAEDCKAGSLPITLSNIIISSPDETLVHVPGAKTSTIKVESTQQRGDVNGDGVVNTTDAVLVINYYLGKSHTIDFNAADMNNDGSINTTDAVLIINKYLNK